jgi:hypothetical protein
LAPPRRHRRRIYQRTARAVTTTPSYWLMEPSLPRSSMPPLPPFGTPYTPNKSVDLERLTRPPEGITPFTVARSSWWTSGMRQEQEASGVPAIDNKGGSPVVDLLVWCTTNLMISDRLGTPTTREDPPSPTSVDRNPKPNRSSSGSLSSRLSPTPWKLGHLPDDPVTLLDPDPTGRRSLGCCHRCTSFGLNGAASPVLPIESSIGVWGRRKMACHSSER